jgi:hypothetical protein
MRIEPTKADVCLVLQSLLRVVEWYFLVFERGPKLERVSAAKGTSPDQVSGHGPDVRAGLSKAFRKDRQKIYKEMWERVERLNVEGRIEEIPDNEFSRRIAEINAFLLTSNVYIDDADRILVGSYARAARAFHEAVRSSGDEGAKLALGDTDYIPAEVIQRVRAIAKAQKEALALRASLLDKVRAVVSGRSE